MSAGFAPADHQARRRIREDLDATLLVEAGAGTGKTQSLVERAVALIRAGRATAEGLAIITFTEAAAAELRQRVRAALETAAEDADLPPPERERCRQAAEEMDAAAILTLHGFAGLILRERPLEAGLPPAFEVMDEVRADMAFQEAWERWLDTALEDRTLRHPLATALALGLTVDHLRSMARALHDNYDLLMEGPFTVAEAPKPHAVRRLVQAAPEIERLCRLARRPDDDPLVDHCRRLLGIARRLGRLQDPASPDAYQLLDRAVPIYINRGNRARWRRDPATGLNACKALKDLLAELDRTAREELEAVRRYALSYMLVALRSFVLGMAQERRRAGTATFHDLLVWARDLLRDDMEARDHFRRRWSHILIDEFQDTDPLQAEIALFLAEQASPDRSHLDRPRRWTEVSPTPGKLFIVGDPRQSIYRFRRADVTLVGRLRAVLGQRPLYLTQNFRSGRGLLAWVNHLFQRWFQDSHQEPYVPLDHRRDGPQAAVRYIGGPIRANAHQVRRREAREVAALVRRIREEGWPLPGEGEPRPAAYGDICILLPSRTGLTALEGALEEVGVPYRVEGASLVFSTQEVGDLLNCLRAVDDPTDQVSLVAALKGPAFACSDADLLTYVEAGGRLDYLAPGRPSEGPVAEALEYLARLHRRRTWVSPARLAEELIRERRLMEGALAGPRPRERWRRYQFLLEQARAFTQAGGSLRAFVRWVERQQREEAKVTETPAPEGDEDAVRIMTVHGAKGLEFPIVVLTGLGSQERWRPGPVLVDRETGRMEVSVGPKGSRFQTAGYQELAEHERLMDHQERVRLMYVAATRARDYLVVSLFRREDAHNSLAAVIEGYVADGGEHLWTPLPPREPARAAAASRPAPSSPPSPAEEERRRREWARRRAEALAQAAAPETVAATALAHEAKEEAQDEGEPWRRGRAGTSLGRAVHATLQTVDLEAGRDLEVTARAQAEAERIGPRAREVVRLVRRALESAVVRRAVASGRLWREVPVAVPLGGGLLEGFIDLLFQEPDGLVIVDYKTDVISDQEVEARMAHYRLQAGAYALAVQEATGLPVKEVTFLFLVPGREQTVADVTEAMEEARRAALQSLAPASPSGRA